jgi:hypothetical protein
MTLDEAYMHRSVNSVECSKKCVKCVKVVKNASKPVLHAPRTLLRTDWGASESRQFS